MVAIELVEGRTIMFGCPTKIHIDHGKEFINKIWTQLFDRLQIQQIESPVYSPQANVVERFHRALNQIRRVYINMEGEDWDQYVPLACPAYNSKDNAKQEYVHLKPG